MATHDKTGSGGTTGHPSNGRTPYLVENTIDFTPFDPAANDIVQAIDIPAESIVLNAGLEVLTASPSSVTLDLGDANDVDTVTLTHTSAYHKQLANAINDAVTRPENQGKVIVFADVMNKEYYNGNPAGINTVAFTLDT